MQSSADVVSLGAAEAAALLGVKPQTLYAYASRGLLRRVGGGKRRRYLLEDLQRLQARQRARSGQPRSTPRRRPSSSSSSHAASCAAWPSCWCHLLRAA
jgi:hypothetical protein